MIYLWPNGAPLAEGDQMEDKPRLTSYVIHSHEPTAAVIVCPGGGYGGLSDIEREPIAGWLNSIGISAFLLDYRVAPYRYPSSLLDAQRAIRYVRSHAADLNIRADKIGMIGFSAGGHLASTVGTHYDEGNSQSDDYIERVSSRPDAMILCYPVISFGAYANLGSMVNLLGKDPDPILRDSLSNEQQVTADTPPTFLWHTSDDAVVVVANSLLFASALSHYNVPFELHCYESGPHGLGLALNHNEAKTWTLACETWLHKQGF